MSNPLSLIFSIFLTAILAFGPSASAFAQVLPETEAAAEQSSERAGIDPALAEALVQALEDPAGRAALIEYLRGAAGASRSADTQPAPAAPTLSLAQRIGAYTQGAAEAASAVGIQIVRSVYGLAGLLEGTTTIGWEAFGSLVLRVVLVAAAAFAIFYLLRLLARRPFASLERRSARVGTVGRLVYRLAGGLIDLAIILVAWAAGYGIALFSGAEMGRMQVQLAYFLNAFLVVEAIKVALRFLLAPRYGGLRVLRITDTEANFWYFWSARLTGFLGYGILFFVSFTNSTLSFAAGRGLRMVIQITAAVMAIVIILQKKSKVGEAIRDYGEGLPGISSRRALQLIGGVWHIFAIFYVVALFLVSVTRPDRAMEYMLVSTAQTLIAIAAAALVMAVIRRAITGGMRLPEDLKARLPLLERQLNHYVPTILKIVRFIILMVLLLAVVDIWELVDVVEWAASETGSSVIGGLFGAFLTVLIALVLWLAVSSWIDYRLNPSFGTVPTARERTLLALFRNAALVTLIVLGLMLALSQIGVNIGPLIAGAGVAGLAIGFGAQKLVQDIITGVFIQFENAMNEGDVVTVGSTTGVVEKLTVRSVGLRSIDGNYHIVPFSSVDTVTNFMRGFSYHVADIGVAYREDIKEVKRLLGVAFERLREGEHKDAIIGDLEMFGVNELGDSAVVVRVRIKTLPGSQWGVGRAYNEVVKEVLDEAGVEIPFPHLTVYMGEGKDGNAPPLRVRSSPAAKSEPERLTETIDVPDPQT